MIKTAGLILVLFSFVLTTGCREDAAGPSDPYELWYSQQNESIVFLSIAHFTEG
ncbi:MAG: hypothetical protein KAR40_15055 [Candidatus Sabulitectum sp.]|nr:hypothetical protein [Candidatus Sabulitectum sp.]